MDTRTTNIKESELIVDTGVWNLISAKQGSTRNKEALLILNTCEGFINPNATSEESIKELNKSVKNFKVIVTDIIEHKKTMEGLSFEVHVYNNRYNQNYMDQWLMANRETIELAKQYGKFYLIDDWRKEHEVKLKIESENYQRLREGEKKDKITKILQEDVSRFIGKYKHMSEEEAIQYVIKEVEDCIFYMEDNDNNNDLSALNILYYGGSLYDAIAHAIKYCAKELNKKPNSYLHSGQTKFTVIDPLVNKPKYKKEEERLPYTDTYTQINSTLQNKTGKKSPPIGEVISPIDYVTSIVLELAKNAVEPDAIVSIMTQFHVLTINPLEYVTKIILQLATNKVDPTYVGQIMDTFYSKLSSDAQSISLISSNSKEKKITRSVQVQAKRESSNEVVSNNLFSTFHDKLGIFNKSQSLPDVREDNSLDSFKKIAVMN